MVKSWINSVNKRFLTLFFTVLFSLIVFSPFFHPVMAAKSEIRGVWLTTNDTDTLLDQPKLRQAIAELARLNFNTLYPVVWNSGYARYPSQIAKDEGIQPFEQKGFQGQDPLADLITQAHQKDLLVLAWFEFGFMTPPTSELALKHPDWITEKRNGSQTTDSAAGEVVWLNPFHPQVQRFILSLVQEVMTQYDVDGIQFDDHLSLPRELGYDPYTRSLYQQETGNLVPSDFQNPEWMRWRADKLTEFVVKLHALVKGQKSNAILSISPNPWDTAYRFALQDWLDWLRKDLIDELVVQVYRDELKYFIKQLTVPEIKEAQKKIPTGIGILTGLRTKPVEMRFIREKIIAARQYGFGVSFFFFDSLWNNAPEPPPQRQSALLALFPTPYKRTLSPIVLPNDPISPSLPESGEPTPPETVEYEDTLAEDGIPIPIIIDY
ncbi:MAG: glycoside hydrolase family 10 protein [Microcystaceae cyanobacterium]